LIAGLACVVRALRPQVRIVGVQSELTPAMFESRRTGRAVLTHSGPPTLAEGLEGGVSDRSFAYVSRWVDDLRLVPETAIADAMRWLWREERVRVEGSAAVGMAALLTGLSLPSPVCVVLSGSNVDPEIWESLGLDEA
jgi:threonine dehydratase